MRTFAQPLGLLGGRMVAGALAAVVLAFDRRGDGQARESMKIGFVGRRADGHCLPATVPATGSAAIYRACAPHSPCRGAGAAGRPARGRPTRCLAWTRRPAQGAAAAGRTPLMRCRRTPSPPPVRLGARGSCARGGAAEPLSWAPSLRPAHPRAVAGAARMPAGQPGCTASAACAASAVLVLVTRPPTACAQASSRAGPTAGWGRSCASAHGA